MIDDLNDLERRAGVTFTDYQRRAFAYAGTLSGPQQRLCLYYRTGAGKSLTALVCVALWGHSEALVITPPSTYKQWRALGEKLGIDVECMSHAKFRMKDTRISRTKPIIADEMHMFGGHGGKGWQKLDRLARGLQAPLVLASATPNYNDADRVYCIQHVMDPHSCKGGFMEFLYTHCETRANPFAMMPDVTGFRNYPDAAAYLADLPGVMYLPDELVYSIEELEVPEKKSSAQEYYGYNERKGKMLASIIEEKHTTIHQSLVGEDDLLQPDVLKLVEDVVLEEATPLLVFSNHSTVAEAAVRSLSRTVVNPTLVTGKTTTKDKQQIIQDFLEGKSQVLVGTASLATGTDGLDKICDRLLILDDTDDASLRRQLIGRIMPRGLDNDASNKRVIRINLIP